MGEVPVVLGNSSRNGGAGQRLNLALNAKCGADRRRAAKELSMSLRVRVVVAIALVLLFGSVVGTAVAGWQAKQALREELAAALAGGRQTVQSAFEDLPRSDHPARDLRQLIATFDGNRHVAATLIDPAARVRLSPRGPRRPQPAPAWFAGPAAHAAAPSAIAVPVPATSASSSRRCSPMTWARCGRSSSTSRRSSPPRSCSAASWCG